MYTLPPPYFNNDQNTYIPYVKLLENITSTLIINIYDSLSDTETYGNDNSTPIGWISHYPISRERFPFSGTHAEVKVILENPQDPMEIF